MLITEKVRGGMRMEKEPVREDGRGAAARALFYEGYNCSQAVFCAFCDKTGVPRAAAAKLAGGLGGGVGRLREVCGAVTGAVLALSAIEGYADPGDPAAKAALYARVQELAARFREKNGALVCRELLSGVNVTEGGAPEPRTPEFYEKRPCPRLIFEAADILEQMLAESAGEGE